MTSFRLRQLILLLAAFAVGTGSLLVAGSALADQQLFRIQQIWNSFPDPADTPGGAGYYGGWVQPYLTKSYPGGPGKEYLYPAGVADVQTTGSGNPVGAAFTLRTKSFHDLIGTYTITPKTGWPGYTTYSYLSYYNGPAKFRQQNTHTNQDPTRIVFPTTLGNPVPNYAKGEPVTPTTTWDGKYDFQRVGEINVTPGPRQFGGTYHYFHGPNNSTFYQFIYKFSPAIYKAYGHYSCFDEGKFGCTKDTFVSSVGDTTAIYTFTRFLLNGKGTGTGDRLQTASAKATTPTDSIYGQLPTVNGQGVGTTIMGGCPDNTPTGSVCDAASYVSAKARYLQLIHPWTTGFASVSNPGQIGTAGGLITPQYQGYDTDLGGEPKLTITRINAESVWNKTVETLTVETETIKSYLYNVGRVVSLVRPKLIHTYTTPVDKEEAIWFSWGPARMWRLKVYFLPEPTGMLLLGTGIVALLGLARIRRR
jgi:hypothetical protein